MNENLVTYRNKLYIFHQIKQLEKNQTSDVGLPEMGPRNLTSKHFKEKLFFITKLQMNFEMCDAML